MCSYMCAGASMHECIWESEGHHDIITRNAVCLLKRCSLTVLDLTSFPKLADQRASGIPLAFLNVDSRDQT